MSLVFALERLYPQSRLESPLLHANSAVVNPLGVQLWPFSSGKLLEVELARSKAMNVTKVFDSYTSRKYYPLLAKRHTDVHPCQLGEG